MEQVAKTRRMGRGLVALSLAGASMFVFAGPSLGAGKTVRATDDKTFSPSSLSVGKGTKVIWKNTGDDRHNVSAYKGRWKKDSDLAEGSKTSFKFRKAGTYKYRCTLHSKLDGGKCDGMCGSVSVR